MHLLSIIRDETSVGIDFGEKRVEQAVGNEERSVADADANAGLHILSVAVASTCDQ